MDTQEQHPLEAMFHKTQSYTKTTLELSKLKALNATANVIPVLLARLSVFTGAVLFFLIISIGAALWLGEQLGELYYGFFIVGGIYFVVTIVIYFFFHTWIHKPFANLIVSKALD